MSACPVTFASMQDVDSILTIRNANGWLNPTSSSEQRQPQPVMPEVIRGLRGIKIWRSALQRKKTSLTLVKFILISYPEPELYLPFDSLLTCTSLVSSCNWYYSHTTARPAKDSRWDSGLALYMVLWRQRTGSPTMQAALQQLHR